MDYLDDRMYVFRISADFQVGKDGSVSINGKELNLKSRGQPIALITYRNISSLPAVRFDDFSNMDAAENYIRRTEPTCPRFSLGGEQPDPTPTWEEHLDWLHANGLVSVLEGNNPLPTWAR